MTLRTSYGDKPHNNGRKRRKKGGGAGKTWGSSGRVLTRGKKKRNADSYGTGRSAIRGNMKAGRERVSLLT